MVRFNREKLIYWLYMDYDQMIGIVVQCGALPLCRDKGSLINYRIGVYHYGRDPAVWLDLTGKN